MSAKTHFPFLRFILKTLSGGWARRVYIVIALIVLCLATAFRLRSYLITRKIHAVLNGLAEIHIDQTAEEQLPKLVPYLKHNEQDWNSDPATGHRYHIEISNESDPPFLVYAPVWSADLASWLGYRYIRFDAEVLVRDGRVASIRYGLAREWVRPRAASYIVSAKSVHAFWLPYQAGFAVSSVEDESPQYRPTGDRNSLHVVFTNDAPSERTKRSFQLNLS